MKGPETRLRKKIVTAVQERYPGIYLRKIHGNQYQNIGVPDILGCLKSRFFGMEIKVPGKERKTTPAQLLEISKIRRAGGVAGVVTSIEEAFALLEKLNP
jgi:hypothetical protein